MKKFTFKSLLVMLCMAFGMSAMADDVVLNFVGWEFDGADDWGSGYAQHYVQFDNCLVTFEKANKQDAKQQIADCPVTKGYDVQVEWKSLNVTHVKFVLKQWGTKTKTANLSYSTDGESFTQLTSSDNFVVEGDVPDAVAAKISFTETNNQVGIQQIVLTVAGEGEVTVAAPTFSLPAGNYLTAQTVALSAAEGTDIHYTLNGQVPTANSTLYEAPLAIDTTTTVKAIAVDGQGNVSSVASATYTILTTYTSLAALTAACPETDTKVAVVVDGWTCTGVKGSNAYFTDGRKGINLYANAHGFEQGDVLSGTVVCIATIFKGCPELKELTATTEGLTIVSKGVNPAPLTISSAGELSVDMQGMPVSVEGLTYNAETNRMVATDGTTFIPYGTFITLPTLYDGQTYNLTGVAIYYNEEWEIAPRSENEIVLCTNLRTPVLATASAPVTELVVGDVNQMEILYDGDGIISATSSNPDVATVVYDDDMEVILVTALAAGTTDITISASETDTYLAPAPITYTLRVKPEGITELVWIPAQLGLENATDLEAEYDNSPLTLRFDIGANEQGNSPKYYTTGEAARLYVGNTMEVALSEGYTIVGIELTFAGANYTGSYEANVGDYTVEGAVGTWAGEAQSVVFTAGGTSRLQKVTVSYVQNGGDTPEPKPLRGDVNGDGVVDVADVIVIYNIMAGLEE